MHWFDGHRV